MYIGPIYLVSFTQPTARNIKTLSRSRALFEQRLTKNWIMKNVKRQMPYHIWSRMFNTEHCKRASEQAGRQAGRRTKSILLTTECLSVHRVHTYVVQFLAISLSSFVHSFYPLYYVRFSLCSVCALCSFSRSVCVYLDYGFAHTHTHACTLVHSSSSSSSSRRAHKHTNIGA